MPTSSTNPSTKVATLTLPTHDTRLTALVWPSPHGTMLFLAELNLAAPAAQTFLAALADNLENKWRELAPLNLPPDAALEQILLNINSCLMMHGRLLGNPLAPRYHLAIAIIQGQAIALSSLGYISALLASASHLTNINQSTPTARGRRITKPTFEQLTCGQIESGETFIISSISLLDYFTTDKLIHLFNEHLPGAALREIEQFITRLPHHSPLGLIALKFQRQPAASGTAPSMEHFLATKSKTAELLKPGLASLLKRLLPRRAKSPRPTAPELEVATLAAAAAKPAPDGAPKITWRNRWQGINFKLQTILAKLVWLKSRDTIKQTITWWLEIKLSLWRNLTVGRKIIFIVAVILLAAFCQSIVNIGKNNLKRADTEQYNRQLTQIMENESKAQTAMIYRDDIKAQEYLSAAQKILANLPSNSASRERQKQALGDNLQSLWRRLGRETIITSLKPWATLPDAGGDSGIAAWWSKNNFWLVTSGGIINSFSPTGKITKTIKLKDDFGAIQLAAGADSKLLAQSHSGQQAVVELGSGRINYLNKTQLMKDAFFYQGRIYYLDDKPTSIFRTFILNDNLATPVKWLREPEADFSSATSLAVDGAIYVALADRVEKYSQGIKQNFALQTFAPINPYDLIRSTSETDYLYVLNRSAKAIALFDKQGKLILRLLFPELPAINTFAVAGAQQILYLASNQTIYQVELTPHLK